MNTHKILIILGMHRSGTSLITRWLQACGLHVGDTLLGAETGNEEGHFEDVDFMHLHEELLLAQKLPASGLSNKAIKSPDVVQEEKIKNLFLLKNTLHAQWGWKDPRTCLFLEAYRKLLPGAFYVIILRGYQPVVSSLLNRHYKGLNRYYQSKGNVYKFFLRMKKKYNKNWLYKTYAKKYVRVWIAYSELLLKHIEAAPQQNFAVINYAALLKNENPFFEQLEKWGFILTHQQFKSVFNAQMLGNPVNIEALVDDPLLLAKAKQLETRLDSFMLKY
jgi:hypothetical protein